MHIVLYITIALSNQLSLLDIESGHVRSEIRNSYFVPLSHLPQVASLQDIADVKICIILI
jgi:hypothetical protein